MNPEGTGPLTMSPFDKVKCGTIVAIPDDTFSIVDKGRPFEMTNRGLRIELRICQVADATDINKTMIALLNCGVENDFQHPLGISVRKISESTYVRTASESLFEHKYLNHQVLRYTEICITGPPTPFQPYKSGFYNSSNSARFDIKLLVSLR